MTLEAQIEAILFYQAEPVTIAELAKAVERPVAEVKEVLEVLAKNLTEQNRGVTLVWKEESVMLGTHPEASVLIEKLRREALSRDLGKASLETLTAILYQSPVARAQVDYLRGVNSSFILRHLMVRGLVERIPNPADARSYLYQPSFQLLQHLGLSKLEDLPEYGALREKLETVANVTSDNQV